jgi:hypothetical protein
LKKLTPDPEKGENYHNLVRSDFRITTGPIPPKVRLTCTSLFNYSGAITGKIPKYGNLEWPIIDQAGHPGSGK